MRLCETLVQHTVAGWRVPPTAAILGCQTPPWTAPDTYIPECKRNLHALLLAGGTKDWPCEIDIRPLEHEPAES